MQPETLLGWHFVGDVLRDGRPIPPDGEWLIHDGPIVPCKSGLHMSTDPLDALAYAPGATLCRVELAGEIVGHGEPIDKHVGRRRRIIQRIDATQLLRRFAADNALRVAHRWDMPAVVRQYLETLDESLRSAAERAAWAAARSAARAAAWAAARAAAWAAADSAAWAAARSAARSDLAQRVYSAFSLPSN